MEADKLLVDYQSLAIDQVVMHQVPKASRREEKPEPLLLSDVPVTLGADNLRFLTGRLREALVARARPVVQDGEAETPVPELLRGILNGRSALVGNSQQMATHLRKVQPGTSPSGLLMVVTCKIAKDEAIVVAKVEHHHGMRVEQETDKNGHKTFNVTYLRDLIFGEGTRIYKIAAFMSSGIAGKVISGEAADTQNGRSVANFFLGQYLGCVFTERGDVLTQRFYESANLIINQLPDPSLRARYEIALLAEMQKGSATVNPSKFVDENILPEHRDAFASRLESLSVPMRPFSKDTTLIKTVIARMKIDTARNATLLVPPEMYADESLTITAQPDGTAHLLLKDKVEKISGTRGPKPAVEEQNDGK